MDMIKSPNKYLVRNHPTMEGKTVSPHAKLITHKYVDVDGEMDALRKQGFICHHVYVDNNREIYLNEKVIIQDHTKSHVKAVIKKLGLNHLYGDFFQISASTNMNPAKFCEYLNKQGIISQVDENLLCTKGNLKPIKDNGFFSQWHLHTPLFPSSVVKKSIHAHVVSAWGLLGNRGSEDVVIGILDDGLDISQSDFPLESLEGWAYFEGDSLIANVNLDTHMYAEGETHGTSVAGVTAAHITGTNTVGVSPGCKIYPIKMELDEYGNLLLSSSKLYQVVLFLNDKVNIWNNSWGSLYYAVPYTIFNAMQNMVGKDGKGVLSVWGSGNNSVPIYKTDLMPPASLEIPYSVNSAVVPTTYETRDNYYTSAGYALNNSLVVGACSSLNTRSKYSNYGIGLSVVAPSSNSDPWDSVSANGSWMVCSGADDTVANDFGGTSGASPVVAGIAALIKSANPNLTAIEIKGIIEQSADKDLDFTDYTKLGDWDVSPIYPPEFDSNGWSHWFGYGKVNAYKAVRLAKGI